LSTFLILMPLPGCSTPVLMPGFRGYRLPSFIALTILLVLVSALSLFKEITAQAAAGIQPIRVI